ncbi:TFP11-domain-containing protein [Dendrothele bispora CBS 962.96]|uniref:TFP11-domain-containing protein n=1 Tax=Dendrothele bispora (strain CBS 962.96) TaxID=1314807 RepID=A0A4S8MR63_DENBC|nr:TFP11-domain-containing protein [Dendrothele bispora CBS 962.96]
MARRKRVLDDDSDSDSYQGSEADEFGLDNDPDAREERALFEDPYKRKRRRKNGKEDAIYGVFGDDSDGGDYKKGGQAKSRRSDWAKAPAFVSGEKKVDLKEDAKMDIDSDDEDEDGDEAESEGEGEGEGTEDSSDNDSEPSRRLSPRIREYEDDKDDELDTPSFSSMGGIGSSKGGIGSSKGGIGSSKGGIGSSKSTSFGSASLSFSKGGIGSLKSTFSQATSSTDAATSTSSSAPPPSEPTPPASTMDTTPEPSLPSAFGGSRSTSFMRDNKPSIRSATPLTREEQAHFSKISGSFGARMLEKMGWKAGTGLGVTGEGIVTPVETKMRPERSGIAFRGFRERTEQSKREARRRGELASDDEDDDPKIRKAKKQQKEAKEKRSDVWKKPKKVKTKVQHKTYEEIIAEAGEEAPASVGIGQIIDATGAVPREVSSLSDINLNTWAPSADPTRIPEVRHNIRLIAESCKTDLDGLAREAKSLQERKKWVTREDIRLRKKVEDEAELIARLQQVQIIANEIDAKAKELASVYEVSLDPFSPIIYKLVSEYENEFRRYRLDEVVVAAIAPLVRRMVTQWNPLEEPTAFISTFRNWRRALLINEEKPPEMQVDVYGSQTTIAPPVIEKPMTPFESLLWNVWLPKVRTAINNEWSPKDPQPAVKLYEAWSTFLPPFIRDNVLDQLILPKVQKAVAEWNAKLDDVPLQAIIFPWLPHVGLRLEDVMGDARRKIKSLLRNWSVGDKLPTDLKAWRDVFDAKDWDNLILKYVIPKLGATLRNDFRINPRDQKMEPLQNVLLWADLIHPSIFSQLFETGFFPKWLDILYVWLIEPKVDLAQVSDWYGFWKEKVFPESLQSLPGISKGFTRGLQLMNQALELGPDAPTRLPKPDYRTEQAIASPSGSRSNGKPKTTTLPAVSASRTQEITFRSLVEEFAASHNLLFVPTGKAHEKSRMPLFRVSPSADGKGGLLVYILDDAVWAANEGVGGPTEEYKAISLDTMVSRASG